MAVFLAVLGLLLWEAQAQTDCTDIDGLDNIEIFLLGTQLVVVWQEPENMEACGFENIMHRVTYTGYESVQEVDTAEYFVYFQYAPYRCVPGVITITAYNDDVSTTATVEYYTENSQVEDLTVNQDADGVVVASWSKPEDSEFCSFIYLVTYRDETGNTASTETTDLQATLDSITLSSCVAATIVVTPLNGDYVGVASSVEYEGDINPVRNYVLSEVDSQVVVRFDPPLGIEYCDVTYEVREAQGDCYEKVISVAAYDGNIYSSWVSNTIEVSIGRLSDLSVTVGADSIEISWTPPSNAQTCGITYQVIYDGETYSTSDSSLTLSETAAQACIETPLSVSAVSSSGQIGAVLEVQVQGDLTAVDNLALEVEDSTVVATWDAPPNSSSCVLSYFLEYTNESGTFIDIITENSYIFEYASSSCAEITLSVVPYSDDGSVGSVATVTLPGVC